MPKLTFFYRTGHVGTRRRVSNYSVENALRYRLQKYIFKNMDNKI